MERSKLSGSTNSAANATSLQLVTHILGSCRVVVNRVPVWDKRRTGALSLRQRRLDTIARETGQADLCANSYVGQRTLTLDVIERLRVA